MAVFMFWNIARRDLGLEIGEACREHDVDVLILAECTLSSAQLFSRANDGRLDFYEEATSPVESRLRFFTKLPLNTLRPLADNDWASIRSFRPPIGTEIIVVGAHISSKLFASPHDQHHEASLIRDLIARTERAQGHSRTLVIGDLNMNPFEPGLTAANGFHAIMDKDIALKGSRRVQGADYDFFYNPMWSRLGDESQGPAGTYYLNRGGRVVNHFWETFDQVLLRPALLPYYKAQGLKVLDRIADRPLIRNGVIDRSYSDHLPLLIKLDLEGAHL
jgi:hypothetical protein